MALHSAALEVLDRLAAGEASGGVTYLSLTAALLPVMRQLERPPNDGECASDAQVG